MSVPMGVLTWIDGAIQSVEWTTDANLPLRANSPEARAAIAELIEAAEWMSAYFHEESSVDRVVRLRAAIAKATGESP